MLPEAKKAGHEASGQEVRERRTEDMENVIRCRKCGKKMKQKRIDEFKVKLCCDCGFSEYRPAPSASRAINPHYSKESLLPVTFDDTGEFVFQVERADREKMEIITLEEISMLASSDYDLSQVLRSVCEKTAKRLDVDICSIYLWDSDLECLTLRGTYGLSQDAVGKARLKIGEGITGSAIQEKKPILVPDISNDPRYKYFAETKEEQYRIKTMYSFPIFQGDRPFGVLNAQTVVMRDFKDDERYFVGVVANIVLGAVKMRKRL
ncbi:MAG: GAF domain-containing protein [Deltaproteobacteria bacterium]|nr:GAF domain-containing protein [Deltaproteobacteria bacterium]